MSRWNRPMRRFQSAALTCQQCSQPVRAGQYGGWEHVKRVSIAAWHVAVPVSVWDAWLP